MNPQDNKQLKETIEQKLERHRVKRILVVDDKEENRALARRQLSRRCQLHVAATFTGAKTLLEKYRYDAVLTDVMLPGEPYGVYKDSPEIGRETPYGLVIALLAHNKHARNIALVTDLNHHAIPIAWALDSLKRTGQDIPIVGQKDWTEAVERLGMDLPETLDREPDEKKRLLVILADETTQGVFPERYQPHFPEYEVEEMIGDDKEIIQEILTTRPELIFLHREVTDRTIGKYHGRELFEKIKAELEPDQKLLVAGFDDKLDDKLKKEIPEFVDLITIGGKGEKLREAFDNQ